MKKLANLRTKKIYLLIFDWLKVNTSPKTSICFICFSSTETKSLTANFKSNSFKCWILWIFVNIRILFRNSPNSISKFWIILGGSIRNSSLSRCVHLYSRGNSDRYDVSISMSLALALIIICQTVQSKAYTVCWYTSFLLVTKETFEKSLQNSQLSQKSLLK